MVWKKLHRPGRHLMHVDDTNTFLHVHCTYIVWTTSPHKEKSLTQEERDLLMGVVESVESSGTKRHGNTAARSRKEARLAHPTRSHKLHGLRDRKRGVRTKLVVSSNTEGNGSVE